MSNSHGKSANAIPPKTLEDWEDLIREKWVMSVGLNSPSAYNPLVPDMNLEYYRAVSSFYRAENLSDEKQKSRCLAKSAVSAGKYVKMAVERGNIDAIRNLFNKLKEIGNGEKSRAFGHANDQVGQALLRFIDAKNRLPETRSELRSFPSKPLFYDLQSFSRGSLNAALIYYSLNKMIRDKTGPKPT